MAESVYRVTEVVGVSSDSWEQAAKNAVETVGGSVRELRIARGRSPGRDDRRRQDLGVPRPSGGFVQVRQGVDLGPDGGRRPGGDGLSRGAANAGLTSLLELVGAAVGVLVAPDAALVALRRVLLARQADGRAALLQGMGGGRPAVLAQRLRLGFPVRSPSALTRRSRRRSHCVRRSRCCRSRPRDRPDPGPRCRRRSSCGRRCCRRAAPP